MLGAALRITGSSVQGPLNTHLSPQQSYEFGQDPAAPQWPSCFTLLGSQSLRLRGFFKPARSLHRRVFVKSPWCRSDRLHRNFTLKLESRLLTNTQLLFSCKPWTNAIHSALLASFKWEWIHLNKKLDLFWGVGPRCVAVQNEISGQIVI